MSESLGKAVLELAADHLHLDRDMADAEKKVGASAKNMGASFKAGLQKAMVPAIGVLGALGAGAKKGVDAASDLGEQINKTSVVFGKSSPDIQAWAKTTAKSIGISNRAALEAAGTFGNMLVPMGFARGKAADMSKGLVDLSADLASFNNADPADVLESLRAGLAGETEPLRKYGVFLNDARLKQEAMSLGLKDAVGPNGALTANAKAQATYSLILKDTKDAQGDFANTATSAANASRIQAAESEDLNAKLGKGLLPAYRTLQQLLLGVTGFMGEHTGATKIAVGVIAALAAGVLAVGAGMKVYQAGAVIVTAAQWAWNTSLLGFPLVWVVAAIAAVIAVIVLAIKHWDDIKRVTVAVWGAIKSATSAAWGAVKSAISSAVGAVKSVVVGGFNAVKGAVSSAWNAVKGATSSAWRGIRDAVSSGANGIVDFVRGLPGRIAGALGSLAGKLWDVGIGAMRKMGAAEREGFTVVVDFIRSIPDRIVNALGNLGGLLLGAGKAIIQGLINGITSKLGDLWHTVSGIGDKIKSLKGPLPKDRVLLIDEGQAIIQGLGQGIDREFSRLKRDISGYAPTIQATFEGSRRANTSSPSTSAAGRTGPMVNIEHMEVRDSFDEQTLASKLAWRLQTA